ncbi:phosphate transport system regulatory protein PhoU [Candidatus Aerophobetes bacterium]|uniref:Phosphate-specific transport system accessory protein PhoU n=1 Tax=Aerophobetes bacterium TaxID=2030807 RepID=A0A662DNR4_UNCAE|nr:MAG: phosphate transport system regulatory protein PhoU [Candidatus Aerophobetes bacterium]
MLREKLTTLKKDLIEYATLVERMIEDSVKGLLQRDSQLLEDVIEKEEPEANEWEMQLDDLCTNLIARYQPKAKDLRVILMVLKMNNDLERMGDHAVNIAESSLFLVARPLVKPLIDIPNMAKIAMKMLKDSINSFIDENAKLAKDVCERDDTVDALRDQIIRELITFMSSDPSTIERSFHLIRISTNLERIADLSTNICEDVIFMVEGRVIKHHREELN